MDMVQLLHSTKGGWRRLRMQSVVLVAEQELADHRGSAASEHRGAGA